MVDIYRLTKDNIGNSDVPEENSDGWGKDLDGEMEIATGLWDKLINVDGGEDVVQRLNGLVYNDWFLNDLSYVISDEEWTEEDMLGKAGELRRLKGIIENSFKCLNVPRGEDILGMFDDLIELLEKGEHYADDVGREVKRYAEELRKCELNVGVSDAVIEKMVEVRGLPDEDQYKELDGFFKEKGIDLVRNGEDDRVSNRMMMYLGYAHPDAVKDDEGSFERKRRDSMAGLIDDFKGNLLEEEVVSVDRWNELMDSGLDQELVDGVVSKLKGEFYCDYVATDFSAFSYLGMDVLDFSEKEISEKMELYKEYRDCVENVLTYLKTDRGPEIVDMYDRVLALLEGGSFEEASKLSCEYAKEVQDFSDEIKLSDDLVGIILGVKDLDYRKQYEVLKTFCLFNGLVPRSRGNKASRRESLVLGYLGYRSNKKGEAYGYDVRENSVVDMIRKADEVSSSRE